MKQFRLIFLLLLSATALRGMDSDDEMSQRAETSLTIQEKEVRIPGAYFSHPLPGQPTIKEALLYCIHNEQEGIKAANYRLTHYAFAQAMQERMAQKVTVSLIVDKEFHKEFCHGLHLLIKQGARVHCDTDRPYENTHHKFFIFQKNKNDKKALVVGSFNITGQAVERNREDVVILDDPFLIAQYEQYFESFKQSSRPITRAECRAAASKVIEKKSDQSKKINEIPSNYQFN